MKNQVRYYIFIQYIAIACTIPGSTPSNDNHTETTNIEREKIWKSQDRRIQTGAFAPKILLPTLFFSEEKNIDSIQKVPHIVLFWASWCGDCQEETSNIQNFQSKHPDIEWITISLDNEALKAQNYIRKYNLKGIHLFDGRDWRGDACTDYAVALHGIPYIIYIDGQGKILWTGGQIKELQQTLDKHVKTRTNTTT